MCPEATIDPREAGPRQLDRQALAEALLASRADTLATFARYEHALPQLVVQPVQASAAYADWVRQETQGAW